MLRSGVHCFGRFLIRLVQNTLPHSKSCDDPPLDAYIIFDIVLQHAKCSQKVSS
jgi:hypothetical protein